MVTKVPKGWYDISVPLKQGMTPIRIDSNPFKIYRQNDAGLGAKVTQTQMEMSSHVGTHIDSPLHFIPDGSTISDMPLNVTIGPARVIEIEDKNKIKVSELEKHNIKKGDRLIFKTSNSPITYESETYVEDYVYLDIPAAEYLAEKGVALIGLDNWAIGNILDEDNINKTHLALLKAGTYILEDCAMERVPQGEYELLCLPLLIYHGDASPCRAILRPLRQ